MSATASERRMAENEMVFRKLNERMEHGLQKTSRLAIEDNQPEFILTHSLGDMPLHFYCECSDENCAMRVVIQLERYQKIRKHRNHFVVRPGHEMLAIERVIVRNNGYYIVKKFVDPPSKNPTIHRTPINNV